MCEHEPDCTAEEQAVAAAQNEVTQAEQVLVAAYAAQTIADAAKQDADADVDDAEGDLVDKEDLLESAEDDLVTCQQGQSLRKKIVVGDDPVRPMRRKPNKRIRLKGIAMLFSALADSM
jgi:hypothetical protein